MSRRDKDGNPLNSFNYHYQAGTNKLNSVDNHASYGYNALGQMVKQEKGNEGMYLSYDVSGKLSSIFSDSARTQLRLSFIYDESGQRIGKVDHIQNVSSYYVLDGTGNVLAIYDNNGSALQQKELLVYGSGRVGTYNRQNNTYQYELSDYLGNVRVVLNENKTPQGLADVLYYSDYYPFGSEMTLASNDYRYGYQGQYAEKDKESNWLNFMLRMYDPVIGRWMTTDPYGEFYSPYMAMGNNPISITDPDGGCTSCPGNGKVGDTYNTGGATYTNLRDGGWTRMGGELNAVVVGPRVSIPMYASDRTAYSGFSGTLNYLWTGGNENGYHYDWDGKVMGFAPIGGTAPTPGFTKFDIKSVLSALKATKNLFSKGAAKTVPTLTEQAAALSKTLGKNSVTLGTSTKQIRFDLVGKAHGNVPTPHMQIYNKNIVNGVQKSISRASKEAVPMTQQEIRMIRKYIENFGN